MEEAVCDWGEDSEKWVVQKSAFCPGWVVFPPHDGEAFIVDSYPFRLAA